MPMEWKDAQFSFSAGLGQNQGTRTGSPPYLDIAKDGQFDSLGELIARYPFAGIGSNILGGGTISSARRLSVVGDEFLCFTDTALYSWSVRDSAWVLRGTHLAVTISEQTIFGTSGDQLNMDRAELSNTVVFAWQDTGTIYVAARDKTTGATILGPTSAGTGTLPRLMALTTKILLVYLDGGANLVGIAIDPASVSGSIVAATTIDAVVHTYFDVAKVPGQDYCIIVTTLVPNTSYKILKVTAAIVVTSSTKARTCTDSIAVAAHPDGLHVQVVRTNTGNVRGDYITIAAFADVNVNQVLDGGGASAMAVTHVTAAYRSVQDSLHNRCYLYWNDTAGGNIFQEWVDDNNTIGGLGGTAWLTASVSPASHAFDYNGRIYVWLVFNQTSSFTGANLVGFRAALQNTYFLYRDDAFLVAKAAGGYAGGITSTGHLPNVNLTSGATTYSWCGSRKLVIDLSANQTNYAAHHTPHDIGFTFDSNEARRTARLGDTLYISGAEILAYDGVRIVECGFHVYPWTFAVTDSGAAGGLSAGQYAFKITWASRNAKGELDRSTTATVAAVTMAASKKARISSFGVLKLTHKTVTPPAAEVWRTALNPTADAPFYLVTSSDPGNSTNPNRYLSSATSATFDDTLADAVLTSQQTNPDNGPILEPVSPPPATIIFATDTRLFLAGIAGRPDEVWYSKQRAEGEIAAFNDALVIPVPRDGGHITGLAFLNETLIVYRQYAIYAFPGDGFDNAGGGSNYGPSRLLSSDVGAVNQESIALFDGGLIFKASKGWQILNRGWSLDDIGGDVRLYDSETPVSVHVAVGQRQIRCLSSARMLVFDYSVKQWIEWTISDGLHSAIWQGTYHYLASTGPKAEGASYSALTYGMDVETKWIKLGDLLQGAGRVRWFELLGEYRSSCLVRVRVARDYQYDGSGNPSWFDDVPWTVSPTTVGSALQLRHAPSRPQCEAFKVRLTAVQEGLRALCAISSQTDVVSCVAAANWSATLAPQDPFLGVAGNGVTITFSFDAITSGAFSIDVRDHLTWDQSGQRWTEQVNNLGIRVRCRTGSAPTVANMETAVNTSTLVFVAIADATPSKVISAAIMNGTNGGGNFSGGTYTAPTGEAIKLTGLSIQYGIRPGINRRIPVAQKR